MRKYSIIGSGYVKLIVIAIMAMIMICAHTKTVKASYYEINLSIGFDNQAKYGRYVPVKIELYSEEDFEGMLSVNVELDGGSKQVISYPVELEGGEYKQVSTYVTIYNNKMYFSLKNAAGEEVKYKSVRPDVIEDDNTELFVGVLSNNNQMLLMFDDINLGEYSDISFPYILTRSFGLAREDIGDNTLYSLDCLDIIVVSWDILMELDREQIKALLEWAAAEKTLIIEYNSALVDEYGNIYDTLMRVERWKEMDIIQADMADEIKEIYDAYGVKSAKDFYERYNLGALEEILGIYNIAYEERKSNDELSPGLWIYSSDYKRGRIGIINPGAGRDFFSYTTDNNNALLGLILGKACTLDMIDEIINHDTYYMNYDFSYAIEHMLGSMNGKDIPNIKEYIFIICIYIILVGPVLFLVLSGTKKQRYLLVCVMAVSAVFSAIIYKKGEESRFTDIFLQYANIVDISGDDFDKTTYFSINVPYNDTYYMKFNSDYEIKPLLKVQEEDSGENYIEIIYDKDITKLVLRKNVPFSKEHFEAKNLSDDINEWDIDVDISYYYKNVSGTITNNSGKDLEDTALILYDYLIIVGDIKDKEVVDISSARKITLPYHSGDVAGVIVDDDTVKDSPAKSRVAALAGITGRGACVDYVVNRYFEDRETKPVFIGFAEDIMDFAADYEAYGYTMFRKELLVDTTLGNLMFEPVGYENIENKNNNTNYDAYSNTTYSSSVRLQYNLENRDNLYRIIFDNDILDDDTVYYGKFSGQVYFYNYTTLEYDLIDIEREYFDVSELAQYLHATADGGYNLTVQYNLEMEGKYRYTEIKMPRVSVIRRLDNA